jgi:phage baseplate assembly protein W
MANLNYTGAGTMSTYVIDIPFNLSTNGKISIIPDSDHKAWKNKVVTLLSVGTNERIWYHYFGTNIENLLFESSTTAVIEARSAVEEIFVKWAPELTLNDVSISKNDADGTITLNIIYQIPTGQQDSVKITKASLTAAGETIEVM